MSTENSLFEAFFQKNIPYYLDKLELYRSGQRFTFNIHAFLFGLLWFLYRKMYAEALLLLAVLTVEGIIEILLLPDDDSFPTKVIRTTITLLFGAAAGFLGNFLYLRKAERVIQSVQGQDHEKAVRSVKKKGGVSYLFFISLAALIIFFFVYNNYGSAT